MGLTKKIDSGIAIALKNDKILTRPGASPGSWGVLLLPTAVILTAIKWPVSELYRYCAVFSFNLILNSILLFTHTKSNSSLLITKSFNVYSFLPVICTVVIYTYMGLDMYRSICHSLANSLLYFELLPYILKIFPKSFTFGEACIVSQGISLFIYGSFIRLNRIVVSDSLNGDFEVATTVLQVTLLAALSICLIPTSWTTSRQYLMAATVLTCLIPVLNILLGFNVIYWVLEFIFTGPRLRLICCWAACSGLAWGTVVLQVRSQRKASTDTRKVFHILAVAVFLSGTLIEPLLLYFAAGLVFSLFLLIEFIRIRKLPPLAETLQGAFHVYADEKDAGGVALTPIYLLFGCSLPLWLLPYVHTTSATLPLLSGILSIGIGDSCASIVGKHFGTQKWSGSSKTVEGSVACFTGQMTLLLVLASLGYLPFNSTNIFCLAKPVVAVAVASLVEAKTDQIDNLFLPLVTYVLLVV